MNAHRLRVLSTYKQLHRLRYKIFKPLPDNSFTVMGMMIHDAYKNKKSINPIEEPERIENLLNEAYKTIETLPTLAKVEYGQNQNSTEEQASHKMTFVDPSKAKWGDTYDDASRIYNDTKASSPCKCFGGEVVCKDCCREHPSEQEGEKKSFWLNV